ncbi:MAG TPA: GDP-mannose 4,6-dehydratase [Puia sp.]|nr:GDP-mannose 4,6-dehydratase [Puia sp.]
MPTAFITGVTGQDGAYLSRLLLAKGYRVVGLVRSSYGQNLYRLKHLGILEHVELVECDLKDLSQVIKVIKEYSPDEIYNLAAQSSVALSFQQPIGTLDFNINSVTNLLEAIRLLNKQTKFYQASTSEMFGKVEELPITENTHVHPLSPYAISKIAGHHICINYRESYGIFASSGILFNHESYLRGDNFFIKKLLRGALDIQHGKRQNLEFGNLEIKRDFGYSEKYVEAMWKMLQYNEGDDFVICSGKSLFLRDVVEHVFKRCGIPLDRIIINKSLFRPTEIKDIYGSNLKAKELLNWNYDLDFFDVLDKILEEEASNYEKGQYGKN